MIRKSLLMAFVFLLLHALFVRITHISNSQHIWQENINKAQRFLYSKDSMTSVIVGSSLSNRLIMDSLPGIYNLSLQGQNIYDGLAVIFRKKYMPSTVFIEMNIVLGVENKTFTRSLFSPVTYTIRKYFPSLRNEYQPVGQLGKIAMNAIEKIQPESKLLKSVPVSSEMFEKTINLRIREYSVKPDTVVINARRAALRKYVSKLESRGVTVVFFEMPVNERLSKLSMPCCVRQAFYSTFPPDKYTYIPMPDCSEYHTRDGEHLSPEEALRYTTYFKSQIGKYDLIATQ